MKKCDKGWHDGGCCCNCKHHIEDFHHCTTKIKVPEDEDNCVCSQHKGWICMIKFPDEKEIRAHSGWSEHGYCEMWLEK